MKKTIISSLLSVALLSSYPLVNKVGANTLDDADIAAQTGSKTVASKTTDKSQTGYEGMEHGESGEEVQDSSQFWRARTVEEVQADVSQYDTLEELQNYEVVWGDTLWAISQSTNFSVDDLTEVFNIKNADLIFANYTLENQPSLEDSYENQIISESKKTRDMDNMGEKDNMGDMKHDESGEIPEGLEEAENPMYEVGESVILQRDHMPGMEGAEATVSGVFATTAYEVSFNPTNGGERVENHRWVIQEDISESTKGAFEPGEEVTLEADHMEGMEGATAIIDDAVTTNVYMVDYQPTDGGAVVRNHKWFVEEELAQ